MATLPEKLFAGFQGKDAMRDKAEKMLGGEFKKTKMSFPESASTPDKIPMRKYKKGGSVKGMKAPCKYAAGGAAKVRHGVATKAGMPIMKKTNRGM